MTGKRTLLEERRKAHLVLDEALKRAAAGQSREMAALIEPREMPALPGWPEPSREMTWITNRAVTLAAHAVKIGVDLLSVKTMYTGFSQYPDARFEFSGGNAVTFAPLINFCLDSTIYDGLASVIAEAHSRITRDREMPTEDGLIRFDSYPGDDEIGLMELANRFLLTESMLWDIARFEGGFLDPVPYPVRYEAARYLWSPRIAGVAFCLRCGTLIRYRRAGRSGRKTRPAPVCGPCIRGGSFNWPKHARMPAGRGTWWLDCQTGTCPDRPDGTRRRNVFVGPARAERCPHCRSSRLTANRRVPLPSPSEVRNL